jgi:glycosyltransferase involved in cell wall biosynthesis
MRLLYFAPASFGGLADYALEHADALGKLGVDVTIMCSPDFPQKPTANYFLQSALLEIRPRKPIRNRALKVAHFCKINLSNQFRLANAVAAGGFRHVFLVSYGEYLAPLWYRRLLRLARNGVTFGAVIQEPVRNFVVGPLWWHRWSVACAYTFLREAFVHDPIVLDTVRLMPRLRTTVVPYGQHRFPSPNENPQKVREHLGIPPGACMLLAFGHIRDDKNLDLAIQSLPGVKSVYLVVAGKRQAGSQRSENFYRDLAANLGVSDRCRWLLEYITEPEAANLFTACDLVLLTYRRSFRSASGVLGLAAHFRKPCIASSGSGSLGTTVRKYDLGVWVEPDSAEAIRDGLKKWLQSPSQPRWDVYLEDNSWQRNAKIVKDRMFESVA